MLTLARTTQTANTADSESDLLLPQGKPKMKSLNKSENFKQQPIKSPHTCGLTLTQRN